MRAARPRRDECAAVDGLSAATVREIRLCERRHLWPGAVARALADWRRLAHGPQRRLRPEVYRADCLCCDAVEHRRILDTALTRLPARAARELRSQVAALDDLFERRTLPDPAADPALPWWQRRL